MIKTAASPFILDQNCFLSTNKGSEEFFGLRILIELGELGVYTYWGSILPKLKTKIMMCEYSGLEFWRMG